jgi:hypothetical protein
MLIKNNPAIIATRASLLLIKLVTPLKTFANWPTIFIYDS